MAAVRGPDQAVTGFVLLLEDLTERMNLSSRRDDLLRELTEGTRSSLGSIQAAIETVVDYPDMDAEERRQFLGIVREESQRLGRQVEQWVAESAAYLGADWLRAGYHAGGGRARSRDHSGKRKSSGGRTDDYRPQFPR